MIVSAGSDQGPHPVVRALLGLVVGLTAGAIAALLVPRERDGAQHRDRQRDRDAGLPAPGDP